MNTCPERRYSKMSNRLFDSCLSVLCVLLQVTHAPITQNRGGDV
jgi:hypothetical protein